MTQQAVLIQHEDFSLSAEYEHLRRATLNKTGAICTFTGLVREMGDCKDIRGMFLEHYPGMTEKCLHKIIAQANATWSLHQVKIIHRIGQLSINDQIVFVGVSSAHRADAFAACAFIMDYLKTDAPFWKKEITSQGSTWVEAKESDQQRKHKWLNL